MIRLLLLLMAVGIGAWLAAWALSGQGYIAVQFGGWLIETSVSAMALLAVLGLAVLYGIMRLLSQVLSLPERWRFWREKKQLRQPVRRLQNSVQALALMDAEGASTALAEGKDASRWSRLLLAAQLAHASGHPQQRNQMLAEALKLAPEEGFTIRLLKARWLLQEDTAQSLAIIEDLLVAHPRQRTLRALRSQALAELSQWQHLSTYLPVAKQSMSKGQYLQLRQRLLVGLLQNVEGHDALEQLWQSLSQLEKRQPTVAQAYVQRGLTWGVSDKHWAALARAMDAHWDSTLLPLLAQVATQDPYQEIKQVQHWLVKHSEDAGLWWLAGELAQKVGLQGQAIGHYQHSLQLAPSAPAALALAAMLEAEAKPEAASALLRQTLVASSTPNRFEPLPQIQQAG